MDSTISSYYSPYEEWFAQIKKRAIAHGAVLILLPDLSTVVIHFPDQSYGLSYKDTLQWGIEKLSFKKAGMEVLKKIQLWLKEMHLQIVPDLIVSTVESEDGNHFIDFSNPNSIDFCDPELLDKSRCWFLFQLDLDFLQQWHIAKMSEE